MVEIKRPKDVSPKIERLYIKFGDRHESFGAINEPGQEILIGNILVDEEPNALNAQALGIDKDMIEGEVGFFTEDYIFPGDLEHARVYVAKRSILFPNTWTAVKEQNIDIALIQKPGVQEYLAHVIRRLSKLKQSDARYFLTDSGALYIEFTSRPITTHHLPKKDTPNPKYVPTGLRTEEIGKRRSPFYKSRDEKED